jgi:hypothetical protein
MLATALYVFGCDRKGLAEDKPASDRALLLVVMQFLFLWHVPRGQRTAPAPPHLPQWTVEPPAQH